MTATTTGASPYSALWAKSLLGSFWSDIQKLAESVYPDSQCGFRAERSTIDMGFSLRQLQEKCREQPMPVYIAFIDLTKAFDLVSRAGLFRILSKIGCPPKLHSLIESFHNNMQGTVQFNGSTSEPFNISNGVKQGCVLAPTLFGIFFALLLKPAFGTSKEGIYLHTRSDGRLFKIARLRVKTKVREVLIRDMLFAHDAAIGSHTRQELQSLMDRFSQACKDFGYTISLKKTNVLGQGTETPPTITDSLSLDVELDKRIGKAATTLARLTTRVWSNLMLTEKTKMAVYNACVISILLYGSETWTTYARQERRLNTFHMISLRRILGISWQDKVPNTEALSRAVLPSMFTLLTPLARPRSPHARRPYS